MARWGINEELYNDLRRAGLTDDQICERYRIKSESLRVYKYNWEKQKEEFMERQFFLVAMRKASGLEMAEFADNLGLKHNYLNTLETEPRGVTINEKQWEKLEDTIRLVVKKEIARKRGRKVLRIVDFPDYKFKRLREKEAVI
jgi:hypothetical protein